MLHILVYLVLYVVVVGVVASLLWYLVDFLAKEGILKQPFHKVARVLVVVLAVLVIIYLLLGTTPLPRVP